MTTTQTTRRSASHIVLASKLGVHVCTMRASSLRGARMTERSMQRNGTADSFAIYDVTSVNADVVEFIGTGR